MLDSRGKAFFVQCDSEFWLSILLKILYSVGKKDVVVIWVPTYKTVGICYIYFTFCCTYHEST